MEPIIRSLVNVLILVSIVSIAAIEIYLFKSKIITVWQLQVFVLSPKLLFKYRDHTRHAKGQTGVWYYVFSISILILTGLGMVYGLIYVLTAKWSIMSALIIFLFLLVLGIAYLIYGMAKETHL